MFPPVTGEKGDVKGEMLKDVIPNETSVNPASIPYCRCRDTSPSGTPLAPEAQTALSGRVAKAVELRGFV